MRHAFPYAASAAVLLFGATFLFEESAQAAGAAAGAGKAPVSTDAPARKRPVVVAQPQAEEAGSKAADDEKAEGEPAAATGRRRPVIAPGTEVNLPPPPVVDEAKAETRKADAPVAAPVEAAPLEFQGLPVTSDAEVAAKGPIANPAEARTISRLSNFQYTFSVKPGRPDVGVPVELSWRIQEILHIPDPLFGDRKPIEKVNLHAQITGPEGSKLYQVHALEAPGTFGLHFTPSKSGSYQVQLQRADGRAGHQLQSTVWVGVEPPAPARKTGGDGVEELFADRGADDRTIGSVMSELGRRWMILERSVGTPQSAIAMSELQEQVKKIAGKVPDRAQHHALEFDELARSLAKQVGTLAETEPAKALDALHRIQTQSCLRCHTQYRFGLTESVRGWPSFELKEDLGPTVPALRDASPRGRAPLAPSPSR